MIEKKAYIKPDIFSLLEDITDLFNYDWSECYGLTISREQFTKPLMQLFDNGIMWLQDIKQTCEKIAAINNLQCQIMQSDSEHTYIALIGAENYINDLIYTARLMSVYIKELQSAVLNAVYKAEPTTPIIFNKGQPLRERIEELTRDINKCRNLKELYITITIIDSWLDDFIHFVRIGKAMSRDAQKDNKLIVVVTTGFTVMVKELQKISYILCKFSKQNLKY